MKRTAAAAMNNLIELGPLSSFLSHERHLLTLRSLSSTLATERQVVVFRLAPRSANDESYHWYAIESECPHAGAPMKDAELVFGDGDIEDMEDMFDEVVAVCPTHSYDFNLRTGESSTGYRACTWRVHVDVEDETVMLDGPEESGDWEVVDCQPVSEGAYEQADLLCVPRRLRAYVRAVSLPCSIRGTHCARRHASTVPP